MTHRVSETVKLKNRRLPTGRQYLYGQGFHAFNVGMAMECALAGADTGGGAMHRHLPAQAPHKPYLRPNLLTS